MTLFASVVRSSWAPQRSNNTRRFAPQFRSHGLACFARSAYVRGDVIDISRCINRTQSSSDSDPVNRPVDAVACRVVCDYLDEHFKACTERGARGVVMKQSE